jgi:hypothetical protein
MADRLKLPRALSEEPDAPQPLRPSHQKIIENLDRWANSRELQPPKCGSAFRKPLQLFADESRVPPLASCEVEG